MRQSTSWGWFFALHGKHGLCVEASDHCTPSLSRNSVLILKAWPCCVQALLLLHAQAKAIGFPDYFHIRSPVGLTAYIWGGKADNVPALEACKSCFRIRESDYQDVEGRQSTAATEAAWDGNPESVKFFCENLPSLRTQRDMSGMTPLTRVAYRLSSPQDERQQAADLRTVEVLRDLFKNDPSLAGEDFPLELVEQILTDPARRQEAAHAICQKQKLPFELAPRYTGLCRLSPPFAFDFTL